MNYKSGKSSNQASSESNNYKICSDLNGEANCSTHFNEIPGVMGIHSTDTSVNDTNITDSQQAVDLECNSQESGYAKGALSTSISEKSSSPHSRAVNHNSSTQCETSVQNYHNAEPIHMTLEEVRNSLCSNSYGASVSDLCSACQKSDIELVKNESKLQQENTQLVGNGAEKSHDLNSQKKCHRKSFPSCFKNHLKNIFGMKKSQSADASVLQQKHIDCPESFFSVPNGPIHSLSNPVICPFNQRLLPPVPSDSLKEEDSDDEKEDDCSHRFHSGSFRFSHRSRSSDFTASIEKVKDCGWYWGPVNGQMAEKLLCSEPDGSFIVRDSSDEHYIFSLTFKLNGFVRHVRIEHDQGNFSFGSLQKFKSNTIVDFIENAVEHSRSGRYLFFLHRRPVLGPVRVQLLHPLSRFKYVHSLQHQCRFMILKQVRRDLVEELPLPQLLKDYLNSPYYYSEKVEFLRSKETVDLLDSKPNDQIDQEADHFVPRSEVNPSALASGDEGSSDIGNESISITSGQAIDFVESSIEETVENVETSHLLNNSSSSLYPPSSFDELSSQLNSSGNKLTIVENAESSFSPIRDDICPSSHSLEEGSGDDHYEQLKENIPKVDFIESNVNCEPIIGSQPEYLDPHNLKYK